MVTIIGNGCGTKEREIVEYKYKDPNNPNPTEPKDYSKIAPVVISNCAQSSCHGGSQNPDLRSLDDQKWSRIVARVQEKTMPPNQDALSQADRDEILSF